MTLLELLRTTDAKTLLHPIIYLQFGIWAFGIALIQQAWSRRKRWLYCAGVMCWVFVAVMCLVMIWRGTHVPILT